MYDLYTYDLILLSTISIVNTPNGV